MPVSHPVLCNGVQTAPSPTRCRVPRRSGGASYAAVMPGWVEVAPEVFQARYQPFDVSVVAVRGAGGLLVVDTRGSRRQGTQLRADLRALARPVRCVVNTHAHFDHCFGNQCFGAASIYGQRRLRAHLERYEAPQLAARIASGEEEYADVVLTGPSHLVEDRSRIDLGDRAVELYHLGRGHTDHDLLLRVDGGWLVGDLVEESGPPAYGEDCYPLDWPRTVAALLERVGGPDVVVPGHGAAVDRDFVVAQQADLVAVATMIGQLRAGGVPVEHALSEGGAGWPFPTEGLAEAVRRGYTQLD